MRAVKPTPPFQSIIFVAVGLVQRRIILLIPLDPFLPSRWSMLDRLSRVLLLVVTNWVRRNSDRLPQGQQTRRPSLCLRSVYQSAEEGDYHAATLPLIQEHTPLLWLG